MFKKILLRLYLQYKNSYTIDGNQKLENDIKYFFNIPEIKTKWRDWNIEHLFFKKGTTFDQLLNNTKIIYDDKSKLRKVEEKLYQIKCKFLNH